MGVTAGPQQVGRTFLSVRHGTPRSRRVPDGQECPSYFAASKLERGAHRAARDIAADRAGRHVALALEVVELDLDVHKVSRAATVRERCSAASLPDGRGSQVAARFAQPPARRRYSLPAAKRHSNNSRVVPGRNAPK